jgi:glutamine synthetase
MGSSKLPKNSTVGLKVGIRNLDRESLKPLVSLHLECLINPDLFNRPCSSTRSQRWRTEVHYSSRLRVFIYALYQPDVCNCRLLVKSLGSKYGITPCFMAKPRQGLPGSSGHMHISLVDKAGKNIFFRASEDNDAKWEDLRYLSDEGRHFLAGVLEGLPDIMPIVAPTVNSYKRLVENFWAPVTVSWGLEHRAASIRLITPPSASSKATRLEVRVCGADANPHLVLASILALGWRGMEKKLEISVPPLGKGEDVGGDSDQGVRLAKSLKEATAAFMKKESIAREVFGDDFVDHFGGTREHEIRLWDEAVTDW